ncbi:MAG: radical SAM/SPASM family putative metalloenzyme maturase [Desulfoprunum sp.]
MESLYPAKIYVELTTRCNLHCPMCVKQAEGSCIVEGDMPLAVFKRLLPSLAHTRTLVLNGIGEPLLHPELEEVIRLARGWMPADAAIGFQSNGFLLDRHRAERLMAAGLDTVCLSLDGIDQDEAGGGHAIFAVSRAVEALIQAREATGRRFRIGIETVLSRETIAELPELVRWAIGQEVDYLIATNLFLYDGSAAAGSLFNPNSTDAVAIFDKYNRLATAQGLSLHRYLAAYLKFTKTAADRELLGLVERMQREARDKDIHLHLPSLIEHAAGDQGSVAEAFSAARAIAGRHGLELFLPPLQAPAERSCPFINDQATFVALNGDVMPCHFLWHSYSCRVQGEEIPVRQRIFGNIRRQTLKEIWRGDGYRQFRHQAASADYASCWSCSLGPCPALINDDLYANDCYGSVVPCGHCQWSLGGIRCL